MSPPVRGGKTWYDRLDRELLDMLGEHPVAEQVQQAMQLTTVGHDGRPYAALIGRAEVLADGPTSLRLLLWADSTTTANLARGSDALLTLVAAGDFVGVMFGVTARSEVEIAERSYVLHEAEVRSMYRDRVPYADLTGCLAFELRDRHVQQLWTDAAAVLSRSADRAEG